MPTVSIKHQVVSHPPPPQPAQLTPPGNKRWRTWTLSGPTRGATVTAVRVAVRRRGRAAGFPRPTWPITSCTRALGAPLRAGKGAGRAWSSWRPNGTTKTTVPSGTCVGVYREAFVRGLSRGRYFVRVCVFCVAASVVVDRKSLRHAVAY